MFALLSMSLFSFQGANFASKICFLLKQKYKNFLLFKRTPSGITYKNLQANSLKRSDSKFAKTGGLKWTRTTDLTLIRRAL